MASRWAYETIDGWHQNPVESLPVYWTGAWSARCEQHAGTGCSPYGYNEDRNQEPDSDASHGLLKDV